MSFITQKTERKMIFELSLILQDLGKVLILLEWIFYAANLLTLRSDLFAKAYLEKIIYFKNCFILDD